MKDYANLFNSTQLIETLIFDLKTIGLTNQSELQPNVLKSSTDIQTELEVIAEWFILNTTSSSSLLDIETIINASVEYTNKINPNKCINPDINIQFPLPAYSSLIFVFNIFFNNIIEHSKVKTEDLRVNIDVCNPDGNYLEVKISNNISHLVDVVKTEKKLRIVKNNWNNHESIERSNIEGGSGFDKIKRILLYEAIAKTDKFEYLITSEKVVISLFLPFRSLTINIENIINASLGIYYAKIDSDLYLEPIINIKYPDFFASSSLVVAFSLLINNIFEYSNLSIETFQLKFDVFEPINGYIEIKTSNNIAEDIDIQNIKEELESVKENWNNHDNLENSNLGKDKKFGKIKKILFDALSKTNKFEFSISHEEVSISLFLPFNQSENEKDINY